MLALIALLSGPAATDVPGVVNGYILPGYAAFAGANAALSDMAMGGLTGLARLLHPETP